jgi:hypothetical protein
MMPGTAVEHDVGIARVFAALAQRRREALELFGRQQQARDHPRAVMELAVVPLPRPPHGVFAELGLRRDSGHVQHEAGIHTVIARAHALATVRADLSPALRVRRPRPAGEEIEYSGDDRRRLCLVEPRRLDHRASVDAAPAPGARVEDVFDACVHRVEERNRAFGARHVEVSALRHRR